MASLKDVARLASVSLMTVSRAINNPELLKPDTLKQVQRAIEELNYVPDFSARKIRGQGTKVSSIGVLGIDTATTPFSVEMILSIERTARQFGWSSFVVNLTEQEGYDQAIWQLLAQRPDGIIYTTMGLREITAGRGVEPRGVHEDDDGAPPQPQHRPPGLGGQWREPDAAHVEVLHGAPVLDQELDGAHGGGVSEAGVLADGGGAG